MCEPSRFWVKSMPRVGHWKGRVRGACGVVGTNLKAVELGINIGEGRSIRQVVSNEMCDRLLKNKAGGGGRGGDPLTFLGGTRGIAQRFSRG